MASWKKLIVSGSDAVLSTVTVDTVVCGNLCGEAETAVSATTAVNSCIVDTNANQTRYLVFVNDEGNSQKLNVDKDTLAFVPCTNLLSIGTANYDAPAKIKLISSGSSGPVSSTIQAPTSTAGDTIACLPFGSGTIVVDKLNNTFTGCNTFTECIVATGGVCGEAASAVLAGTTCCTLITAKSDATDYKVVFTDAAGVSQQLHVDNNTLTFNASTNKLSSAGIIGSTYVCGGNVVGTVLCSQGQILGTCITTSGNAIIGGDLTVNGTTTYLNTTNLAVEDRFILLNSGSNTPREAGLVVDEGAPSGSGHAFVYDADTTRWGFTASLDSTTGSVVPDAFVSAVVTDATCSATEYQKTGNIFVCTATQDIYIYS